MTNSVLYKQAAKRIANVLALGENRGLFPEAGAPQVRCLVFGGAGAGIFPEGLVKVAVIVETGNLCCVGDGHICRQQLCCAGNPLFDNVIIQRVVGDILENPANIILAVIYLAGKILQGEIPCQICIDILYE